MVRSIIRGVSGFKQECDKGKLNEQWWLTKAFMRSSDLMGRAWGQLRSPVGAPAKHVLGLACLQTKTSTFRGLRNHRYYPVQLQVPLLAKRSSSPDDVLDCLRICAKHMFVLWQVTGDQMLNRLMWVHWNALCGAFWWSVLNLWAQWLDWPERTHGIGDEVLLEMRVESVAPPYCSWEVLVSIFVNHECFYISTPIQEHIDVHDSF